MRKNISHTPDIVPKFDGWFVDIFNVGRKKLVLITHHLSFLSFVTYLSHIGGSDRIPDWFMNEFHSFCEEKNISHAALERLKMQHSFHKTNSRIVIGHMTDIKNVIFHSMEEKGEHVAWKETSNFLHTFLMKYPSGEYSEPLLEFMKLLDIKDLT